MKDVVFVGKLKFGIIGCGLISNWHADAILRIEGAELAAATGLVGAPR